MLSNLSEKLNKTFAKLRGKGRVSEADVDVALREVRLALLEADVNFKIVKDFIARVRERALGLEVLESPPPGHRGARARRRLHRRWPRTPPGQRRARAALAGSAGHRRGARRTAGAAGRQCGAHQL